MVELNKKGYTYGTSRGNCIIWIYNKGKLINSFNDFSRMHSNYIAVASDITDVPGNTYDCSDATILTKEEFVIELNKMLINANKLVTIMNQTKTKLCRKKKIIEK